MGLLGNLNKTTDRFGNVLIPGSTVPADGGTTWGRDGNGNLTSTPLKAGDTVPPTAMGGVFGNLAKSVHQKLGILEGGSVIP
jgi:hypothetical protein